MCVCVCVCVRARRYYPNNKFSIFFIVKNAFSFITPASPFFCSSPKSKWHRWRIIFCRLPVITGFP